MTGSPPRALGALSTLERGKGRPRPGPLSAAVLLAGSIVAVSVAALVPGAARAAELSVTLDPPTATVGDRVEAVLLLSVLPEELDGEARFPVWRDRWGRAEIVEAGPVERLSGGSGGEVRLRQRLLLAAFRPGAVELPPKQVAVPGPYETAELWTPAGLSFQVASVLPAETGDGEPEPRPPAPPAPVPVGRAFWWTLGCAALGTLALVLAARRGGEGAAGRPPATPGEELEAALASAVAAPAPEEGHVLLSLGLRRFLGRLFGFPAAESTTSEIRRQLRGRRCPPALEARIHEVLQVCDRVKFAREPGSRGALEARVEAAREIARGVRDHLHPPAPGEGAGGPAGRPREEAA